MVTLFNVEFNKIQNPKKERKNERNKDIVSSNPGIVLINKHRITNQFGKTNSSYT